MVWKNLKRFSVFLNNVMLVGIRIVLIKPAPVSVMCVLHPQPPRTPACPSSPLSPPRLCPAPALSTRTCITYLVTPLPRHQLLHYRQ